MTDSVRSGVASELERRELSKRQLALKVDITPQYLSDMLNGKRSKIPEKWQLVLDELGLELCLKSKSKH